MEIIIYSLHILAESIQLKRYIYYGILLLDRFHSNSGQVEACRKKQSGWKRTSLNYAKKEKLIYMEVIILAEEKRDKNKMDQIHASNLNPDDLDIREENDMTKEQKMNSPEAKMQNDKGSASNNK